MKVGDMHLKQQQQKSSAVLHLHVSCILHPLRFLNLAHQLFANDALD